MSSVRTIAKQAGVSITTVSRVLNNHPRVSQASRSKVLTAANAVNYVPAVGRKSTVNIALVYAGETSLGSPFDAAIMQGMQGGMEEHGYDLMVLSAQRSRDRDESYTQMFLRKGVCAAVLRTNAATHGVCETIAAEGFPSVVVGDRSEASNVNYVYTASRHASREGVEHLIANGHRRIAICLNVVDDSDHADRRAGYRDALTAAGIEPDPRLEIRVPSGRDSGLPLFRRLRSLQPAPTAVFVTDPFAAVGLVREAVAAGVDVPGEMSVLGFDDGDARFSVLPTLSAVCQDAVAVGREAVAALHRQVQAAADGPAGGAATATHVQKALRAWLEIHETTGPVAPTTETN